SIIHYDFGPRGDMPPVRVTWYDGKLRPPRPAEFDGDGPLPEEGLLFVGDRGTILCGFNGASPRLIPQSKMNAFMQPPKTLPRSGGKEGEWRDACKGGTTKPGANFDFEGMVTETLLLGNVSLRTGRKLIWDWPALTATNAPDAAAYIRPAERSVK